MTVRQDTVRAGIGFLGALDALGVPVGTSTLVAGHRAAALAAAVALAGAPPVAYDRPDYALLTTSDLPEGVERGNAGVTGLPDESVGLVLVRSAWPDRAGLTRVFDEARRILIPGGILVAGEFDLRRVLRSPAIRYPAQVLYARHPEVAAALQAGLVDAADLAAEAVRHEFLRLAAADFDEEAGSYATAEELASGPIAWPGLGLLSPDQRADLLAHLIAIAPRLAPIGPIVDRLPWRLVRGYRRP